MCLVCSHPGSELPYKKSHYPTNVLLQATLRSSQRQASWKDSDASHPTHFQDAPELPCKYVNEDNYLHSILTPDENQSKAQDI